MSIHPTAVVSPDAVVGKNVEIGPYAVIEPEVEIGDDCYIDAHVKVARYTKIGARTRIYFGALVGEEPQDHRFYPGLKSFTEIGSDCVIREYVTIHRPPFENLKTVIGNHVLLMAFVHIAHDVVIHDRVTIANHTTLSGHVQIGQGAVLSGYILIHQFCRIGTLAFAGARTIILQDIPPFCMLQENGHICGPNTIGLRRAGIDSGTRSAIRNAVKTYFFKRLNSQNAFRELEKEPPCAEVQHFIEFIKASSRGIVSGDPKLVISEQ